MHEMSIAINLVQQVEQETLAHDAVRVNEIQLNIGELQLIVPEALETAFEAASVGTIAEGAQLKINEVKVAARCGECSTEFQPEIGNYVCPRCGKANAEILEGKEIILVSLDCDLE